VGSWGASGEFLAAAEAFRFAPATRDAPRNCSVPKRIFADRRRDGAHFQDALKGRLYPRGLVSPDFMLLRLRGPTSWTASSAICAPVAPEEELWRSRRVGWSHSILWGVRQARLIDEGPTQRLLQESEPSCATSDFTLRRWLRGLVCW